MERPCVRFWSRARKHFSVARAFASWREVLKQLHFRRDENRHAITATIRAVPPYDSVWQLPSAGRTYGWSLGLQGHSLPHRKTEKARAHRSESQFCTQMLRSVPPQTGLLATQNTPLEVSQRPAQASKRQVLCRLWPQCVTPRPHPREPHLQTRIPRSSHPPDPSPAHSCGAVA